MKITQTVITSAAVLATALAVAGCANESAAPASGAASSTAQPSGSAAAADVSFAQQMIPHHQQAVQMSKLAAGRASSPQVTQLAATIQNDQQPEIDQLTAMLHRWNAPLTAPGGSMPDMPGMSHDMPGMGDMDHSAMPDAPGQIDAAGGGDAMPGMMSPRDMDQLAHTTGADFDHRFLSMMIDHHQGALRMADTELRDGRDPQARALAQRIRDAQTAQITQMQSMLRAG
jgi:uncharacterized protein (DUF305 family)